MIRIDLDLETYYDTEYSLRRMTAAEYALDPRFEALGCAFIINGSAPFWVDGPNLQAFFDSIDWDDVFAVSHNALFDMFVLAAVFGVHPRMMGDTLAMARAWCAHKTKGSSLDEVSKHYGLPPKWNTLAKTKGLNFAALQQNTSLYKETCGYGCDDVYKCHTVFNSMMQEGFPEEQLHMIDTQIRMCTQPQFVLDQGILHEYKGQIYAEKQQLLATLGFDSRDPLMSDPQFALLLMSRGVDVPKKISPATGEQIYAFAKSDRAFTDLSEHDDPVVQALVAARLGHKSTIEETRTERFISISNLQWRHGELPGSMPVALKFSGAHTHRFSGDWSLNQQNLGRKSRLRHAVKAPPKKLVVSGDASQIEARINACISGQDDLVEAFRQKRDVYSEFATQVFCFPCNKVDTPNERFVGKTGILSLGYGSGWPTFQGMVRVQSDGEVILSDGDAANIVGVYRRRYDRITENWSKGDDIIYAMTKRDAAGWFCCCEVRFEELILPNGNRLRYHNLRREMIDGKSKWVYDFGRMKKYLYGAKLVENICQALAFVQIMAADLRIKQATGGQLPLALQVHDELIYVVDEHIAQPVLDLVIQEISRVPDWLPSIPLAAEGSFGISYGACKG